MRAEDVGGNGKGHGDVEGTLLAAHVEVHNLVSEGEEARVNADLFVANDQDAGLEGEKVGGGFVNGYGARRVFEDPDGRGLLLEGGCQVHGIDGERTNSQSPERPRRSCLHPRWRGWA